MPSGTAPKGLTHIANRVHALGKLLERELAKVGVAQRNEVFFDTLRVEPVADIRKAAEAARMNFRYRADGTVNIALDETTTLADVEAIVKVFGETPGFDASTDGLNLGFDLARKSEFLTHPTFNTHHSESQMMRYLRSLERKKTSASTRR